MGFHFSNRSLKVLDRVNAKLQRVAYEAIKNSEVDFTVIQGLRTRDEQARLYGQGRSRATMMARGLPSAYARPNMPKVTWTMNSNHMSGNAIDVAPYINGGVYLPDKPTAADIALFAKIADAMIEAAVLQGVTIEWGGNWVTTKDYPHFELKE